MKEHKDIIFPKDFNIVALHLAYARSSLSKDMYKEGKSSYPGDKELLTSFKGLLCELIFREFIKDRSPKETLEFSPLVEHVDIGDIALPDLKISNKTWDIKYGGANSLNVNTKSHANKRPDFYSFIRFINMTKCCIFTFKSQDIDKWNLIDGNYGAPFFAKKMSSDGFISIEDEYLNKVKQELYQPSKGE